MHHEGLEVVWIPERFEDRTTQLRGQIDFPGRTIAKPEPHNISADVPSLENVIFHRLTQMERSDSADAPAEPVPTGSSLSEGIEETVVNLEGDSGL